MEKLFEIHHPQENENQARMNALKDENKGKRTIKILFTFTYKPIHVPRIHNTISSALKYIITFGGSILELQRRKLEVDIFNFLNIEYQSYMTVKLSIINIILVSLHHEEEKHHHRFTRLLKLITLTRPNGSSD